MPKAGRDVSDGEFEENALFQVKLLAQRVDVVVREKEALERTAREQETRIRKMETMLSVGWGIFIVFPILGAILGFLLSYGKIILRFFSGLDQSRG